MKTIPITITADWLLHRKACEDQITKFAAEWPEGAELTEANLLRAGELGLDIKWLALRVLPKPLQAEHNWQVVPVNAKFRQQMAAIQAEYELERARIDAEYRQQCERQVLAVCIEYNRQVAALLWSLLQSFQS